jgi:hypothetical protein
MRAESVKYMGYELQAVQNPPFWQVSIYPTAPNLLAPRSDLGIVSRDEKEDAFAEARRRVDALISK